MKHRLGILVVTSIAAYLLPMTAIAATPKTHPMKKVAVAPTQYRAQCGMIYSAADAKKNHYVCPMDGQKMTAIVPTPKMAPKHPKM